MVFFSICSIPLYRSRFIVTKESLASTSAKNKIVNSNCDNIIEIDKIFRSLKTEKIKKISNNNENLYEILPHTLSSLQLRFLRENDLEEGLLSINLKCHKWEE